LPRLPLPAVLAASLLAAVLSSPARADGLADLKAALTRLQGSAPVKGQADLRTWHRSGEGADATELRAQAGAGLEDGPRGLQVLYARDLLARLDEERRAKAANPQAKTPTVDAMAALQVNELQPLMSAAATLQRSIERATFKGERAQPWNGKPARMLSFETGLDSLSERDRKYVKKFDAGFDVWIGTDGTPLATKLHETVSGRAFVVVTFEAVNEEEQVFALSADRLVTTRHEVHSVSSGMGEHDERRSTMTVQWGS
jgi:hypothetical protein